jgi:hypothetical protein
MELHFGMGWTRFNYSKSGLLAMEGTGSQKMNVLPWEASDRREMLIVGAVDADGHKAAAYFVELYADGKRSLGEWSSSVQADNWVAQLLGAEARTVQQEGRTMRAIPSPGLDTAMAVIAPTPRR